MVSSLRRPIANTAPVRASLQVSPRSSTPQSYNPCMRSRFLTLFGIFLATFLASAVPARGEKVTQLAPQRAGGQRYWGRLRFLGSVSSPEGGMRHYDYFCNGSKKIFAKLLT